MQEHEIDFLNQRETGVLLRKVFRRLQQSVKDMVDRAVGRFGNIVKLPISPEQSREVFRDDVLGKIDDKPLVGGGGEQLEIVIGGGLDKQQIVRPQVIHRTADDVVGVPGDKIKHFVFVVHMLSESALHGIGVVAVCKQKSFVRYFSHIRSISQFCIKCNIKAQI